MSATFLKSTLSQISPLMDMDKIQSEIRASSMVEEEPSGSFFHGGGSKLPAVTELLQNKAFRSFFASCPPNLP